MERMIQNKITYFLTLEEKKSTLGVSWQRSPGTGNRLALLSRNVWLFSCLGQEQSSLQTEILVLVCEFSEELLSIVWFS